VTGITVPLSGHWIPEEQLEFVIEQLVKFFGGNTTDINQYLLVANLFSFVYFTFIYILL
jgi:hypothetical protein